MGMNHHDEPNSAQKLLALALLVRSKARKRLIVILIDLLTIVPRDWIKVTIITLTLSTAAIDRLRSSNCNSVTIGFARANDV